MSNTNEIQVITSENTFTHIGTAPNLTIVLRIAGIYPTTHFEKTGSIPFGRVRDDLIEQCREAFGLESWVKIVLNISAASDIRTIPLVLSE